MTDQELLELAEACGVMWGIGADTGRPRVMYLVGGSLQVVEVEIVPGEYEVRTDPVAALRRAILQAVQELSAAAH
jgi:hypothetical protein